MRRILENLDPRWVQAASRKVCDSLADLFDEQRDAPVKHVLAWATFFPGEVDLAPLFETQAERRTIYVPRVAPDRTMTFVSVGAHWLEQAEQGEFGIPEPVLEGGIHYDPAWARETAILVPGLAFDRQGRRLGRGGGYYDRFLGRPALAAARAIGVGWALQIIDRVPAAPHDMNMDYLCTEEGPLHTGVGTSDEYGEE